MKDLKKIIINYHKQHIASRFALLTVFWNFFKGLVRGGCLRGLTYFRYYYQFDIRNLMISDHICKLKDEK